MAHENLGEMLTLLMKNKEFTSSKYKEHLQIHKEQSHLNSKLVKDINRQFTKLET